MRGSLYLGAIRGIRLFVHWTFLILIGYVVIRQLREGADAGSVLASVAFVLLVFGCVVLHELGHAVMAQQYGIPTRDITLLPIGGVARLERMPEKPSQELLVALAGPAVNVAIAGILFLYLSATGALATAAEDVTLLGGRIIPSLMWVNVTLVVFNMLPAFPMDGGRVLRAALAHRMDYARATRIAAGVGQGMAVVFAIWGLFGLIGPPNPMLVFIALFVWLGAQQEAQVAQMRSAFQGIPVREAMITRFRTLNQDDPLKVAKDELLAGAQQDFPVVADGQVVGVLSRKDLVRGLADRGMTGRVGDAMTRDCPVAEESEPLELAFLRMRQRGCSTLPVLRGPTLTGILTQENVGELMMVNLAMRGGQ